MIPRLLPESFRSLVRYTCPCQKLLQIPDTQWSLHLLTHRTAHGSTPHPGTNVKLDDAGPGTELAVVYISETNQTYLYHQNSTEGLRRVVRDADGLWGSSKAVANAPIASANFSDLCVVATPSTMENHVFYRSAGVGFEHIHDKWI